MHVLNLNVQSEGEVKAVAAVEFNNPENAEGAFNAALEAAQEFTEDDFDEFNDDDAAEEEAEVDEYFPCDCVYCTGRDEEIAEEDSAEVGSTNQTQENTNTMIASKQKPPVSFQPVTLVFNNEAELHDLVAALAAYGRKINVVSGTSIASDLKLTAYTGNARKTVNRLLPQIVSAINS